MQKAGKENAKYIIAVLSCLMLIQCLMLCYWQNQRGGFFVDEMFSLGSANSFTADESHYITEDPVWKYNEWMDAKDLVGLLQVDQQESLTALPLTDQLRLLLKKRSYMGLLNIIVTGLGFEGYFFQAAWRALALNMLFFIMAELLMAYAVKKLTGSDVIMCLSAAMFGFSPIIMGMCEYIRFYMLTIMLLLIVICCHIKIWDEKRDLPCMGWALIAFACAFLALKHSELMVVTCGPLFFFFILSLIRRRRFRLAALYTLPLIVGAYSFVGKKTNLLDIFLHPSNYAQPMSHGSSLITYNLITCTPQRAWTNFSAILKIVSEKWFGSGVIMAAFLILMVICLVYSAREKKKIRTADNTYRGFVLILLLTALVSLIFNIPTGLCTDRHNSFLIVIFMIVFWFYINELRNTFDEKKFILVIAILTAAGVLFSQQPGRFPFLYIDEKPTLEKTAEYVNDDRILFISTGQPNDNYYWELHAIYDSLIHLGENDRVLAIAPEQKPKLKKIKDLPDEFIAYCINTQYMRGFDRMDRALKKVKYEPVFLGNTHLNDIYVCKRAGKKKK